MTSKGRGWCEVFGAFIRWRAFIERHLLVRLFLIRRILSALSINP